MDKQARKERIENVITMAEALQTFEKLPLPERFRKLAEWAETHLSAADQEWIYQQWQQVLERSMEEPPDEAALSVERGPIHLRGELMKTYWITAEITRRAFLKIEAESKDEARAMAEQLLEEGAFEGWEEDLPDVIVEEIPEELTT
jgi:hypothetical protein